MADIFTDEFAGEGGSYTVDPKTDKRVLVERTFDPADAELPEEPTDAANPAQE